MITLLKENLIFIKLLKPYFSISKFDVKILINIKNVSVIYGNNE